MCLHGAPTSGYLHRHVISPLSRGHRVGVPDHMGFGKSETPLDREDTLQTHVEHLVALVEHFDLSDITLVGRDRSGPITAAFAVRHARRAKRTCFADTIAGYGQASDPGFRALWLDAPVVELPGHLPGGHPGDPDDGPAAVRPGEPVRRSVRTSRRTPPSCRPGPRRCRSARPRGSG